MIATLERLRANAESISSRKDLPADLRRAIAESIMLTSRALEELIGRK